MCLKDRVSDYCKRKNIAISRFEKEAGLSNGYFNQVKKRPSIDKIESIKRAYPDINEDWLLTGEGDMLVSPDADNDSSVTVNSHNRNSTINDGDTIKQLLSLLEEKDKQINTLLNIIQKAK